jgi:hypothetical protein
MRLSAARVKPDDAQCSPATTAPTYQGRTRVNALIAIRGA